MSIEIFLKSISNLTHEYEDTKQTPTRLPRSLLALVAAFPQHLQLETFHHLLLFFLGKIRLICLDNYNNLMFLLIARVRGRLDVDGETMTSADSHYPHANVSGIEIKAQIQFSYLLGFNYY